MEKLAEKLTNYTLKQGSIPEESYEVYKYGFQSGLEILTCMIACMIMSMYINMVVEGIIFFIVFIPLRSYAGGLHLNHFYFCFICSCFVLTCTLLLAKNCILSASIAYMIIGATTWIMLKLAPVETKNRLLEDKEKIYFKKKLKEVLLCILVCSMGLGIANILRYVTTIAFTMVVVTLSMIIGKIKLQSEYCAY